MIGLDTNVLLRLLTGDHHGQQARAKAYLETHCTPESPGFINRVVIVELVWVLESAYDYTTEQTASALEALLRTQRLTIEASSAVWAVLDAYRAGVDFADAFIGITNHDAGCDTTVTFDQRAAKRLPHFAALP
ncbi:PIN domain-containing protein [bacterium]|nr:MAG: PIN domain-containing protein [bacterium]